MIWKHKCHNNQVKLKKAWMRSALMVSQDDVALSQHQFSWMCSGRQGKINRSKNEGKTKCKGMHKKMGNIVKQCKMKKQFKKEKGFVPV